MDKLDHPIGVFDSGMGGISVLREITAYMPEENYIYVGDSANAPYGIRPVEEVRELTISHIRNLVENYHAKAIAVACNTATSAAVAPLRIMYPDIPLVGVEPAIKPAVLAHDHSRILVMATPRTLKEEKFLRLEHLYEDRARIYPLPCPGLMEYVEEGVLEGGGLRSFLHTLMDPYRDKHLTGIVLGCTHYPFLRKIISEVSGGNIPLYDGGKGTARELRRRVKAAGLLRDHYSGAMSEDISSEDALSEDVLSEDVLSEDVLSEDVLSAKTEVKGKTAVNDKANKKRGSILFFNTSPDKKLLERSIQLFRYDNPAADQLDLIPGQAGNEFLSH